ncbi:MAG: NAD(P)H-dependent oxidoreductase [Chromatiales bacterium]|jgi:FMN-dependent NADH-azoreductase
MNRHPITPETGALRVLRVDASARREGSATRRLGDELLEALRTRHGDLEVRVRDLAVESPPAVDAAWVAANATAPEDRTPAHRAALAASDALVDELEAADVVVIGMPVYNFGVPAALKAWIDMVARARRTFRYTPNGPEGMLRGKRAYLLMASGGVGVDSAVDFATPYMRHVLGFVGIDAVEVIAADRLVAGAEERLSAARERISGLLAPVAAAPEPRAAATA